MKEKTFPAKAEQLDAVISFVEEALENDGCPTKVMQQMALAAEEIFINIAHYAYDGDDGTVTLACARLDSPSRWALWFRDAGRPFDPTARQAPDVALGHAGREVGGLGIFLVKKMMDTMEYARQDGQNILRIEKQTDG